MTLTRHPIVLISCIVAWGAISEAAEETPVGEVRSPIVIAHRGASALAPEHTLAAYRQAIADGADFIEPDLVFTRDGHLVARHENALGDSTNVAEVPEFASRRTTKTVDGVERTDWFSEDFTLAELRRLRARERLPALRPHNARYADEQVPTLVQILALVHEAQATGRTVGIFPETKHPTYFASEGRYLDGTPIRRSLGAALIRVLREAEFVDPNRVYIQSFEVANLIELAQDIMPAAGVEFPLVQLIGDLGNAPHEQPRSFGVPWDLVHHLDAGHDLGEHYGDFAKALPHKFHQAPTYAELVAPEVLHAMRRHYADALGLWKTSLLVREHTGRDAVPAQLTGAVHPVLAEARAAGLGVHVYTLRPEAPFLVRYPSGAVQSVDGEVVQLLGLGVDGVFVDHPARAVRARATWRGLHASATSNDGAR